MVTRTFESEGAEERDELFCGSLVDTLSFSKGVQMVKHLKQSSTGLMNRTDDCSATTTQRFQQGNTLEARTTV